MINQPAPTQLPLRKLSVSILVAMTEVQPATASLVAARLEHNEHSVFQYLKDLTASGLCKWEKAPKRIPMTADELERPDGPKKRRSFGRRPSMFTLTRRGAAVAAHLADACRAYAETDEPRTNGCATACSQAS